MTQGLTAGNSILNLTNVRRLAQLIKYLETRPDGADGIGCFSGEPGLGKTVACTWAMVNMDAIHISVGRSWTTKTFLQQLLCELSIKPAGTIADMAMTAADELAGADRPLLIDEAGRAVAKGMIGHIRDLHDASGVSIVMIGMDDLPQQLRKWEQFDSRVIAWERAEYATLEDARSLAEKYAPGIDISDAVVAGVRTRNGGVPRRMRNDFLKLLDHCRRTGLTELTVDAMGGLPLARNQAPKPRPRAEMGEVDFNA